MAVRTALLTSRNINLDTDFSKYIETVSEPGVITGFAVTSSSVATGQARVPCERTNGETIYAFVQNFNSVSISGDGYVIISIPQNIIDNGGGNEDGTGIATIEVVNSLPAKNYLLLATITSGDVEDNRNMIPKVGELKTDIDSIFASIEDLDERVEALEEAGAIDHLEEMALVGEKYALTDTLFKQLTPKLADCTVDANVWDVAANTEIHIQRQGSKTASNKLKLKVKKVGSPTTSLYVEVRKGIQVDVSSSEAYWYGDSSNIIATGSLASSSFSSSYTEVEFTLDANFGGTEWELLDVVVYQSAGSGATVNSSNYYQIACDSTQWSEAFSYVKVNWSTRSREKLMPYCVSDWFVQAMLSKVDELLIKMWEEIKIFSYDNWYYSNAYKELWTIPAWYSLTKITTQQRQMTSYVKINDTEITTTTVVSGNPTTITVDIPCLEDTIVYWRQAQTDNNYYAWYSSFYWYKCASKKWEEVKIREYKEIWQKTRITIFWRHIDGTRIKDTPSSLWEFIKHCNNLWLKETIEAPYNTTYTLNNYWILKGNYTSGTTLQVKINDLEVFNANVSSAWQITIPPFSLSPGDTVFVVGNGTNNCYIDLFW